MKNEEGKGEKEEQKEGDTTVSEETEGFATKEGITEEAEAEAQREGEEEVAVEGGLKSVGAEVEEDLHRILRDDEGVPLLLVLRRDRAIAVRSTGKAAIEEETTDREGVQSEAEAEGVAVETEAEAEVKVRRVTAVAIVAAAQKEEGEGQGGEEAGETEEREASRLTVGGDEEASVEREKEDRKGSEALLRDHTKSNTPTGMIDEGESKKRDR